MDCVVCHKNEATQKHHLSYKPEIIIDVCIGCHRLIHKHGVGNGRGFKAVPQGTEETLPSGNFTSWKKIDGNFTVVDKKGDVLSRMVCGCGEISWHVYGYEPTKSYEMFLRCDKCGRDFFIETIMEKLE